jgi:hypothetical protein
MDDEADTGGAERAFEALRAEVATLRQTVEGQTAPDYALTLGAIAKELQAIGARLDTIENHPAMAMTPERFAGQLDAAVERAHQAGSKAVWDATAQLGDAVRRVEHLAGTVSTREEQRRWLGVAMVCGAMLGIALWYVLPSLLPWGAGDWLASSLIGGGRWRAGETLMERASPESFDRMVQLYNACGERPVEACEAVIAGRAATTLGEPRRSRALLRHGPQRRDDSCYGGLFFRRAKSSAVVAFCH